MAESTTRESPFLESLKEGQAKAGWVPGVHFELKITGDLGVDSIWLGRERMIFL